MPAPAVSEQPNVPRELLTDHEFPRSNNFKNFTSALEVARSQTNDIETLYLRDLDRKDRTPAAEAQWLSYAEHMLQTWGPYLKQTEAQMEKFGGKNIQVVG